MRAGLSGIEMLVATAMLTTPTLAQDWNTLISGDEVAGYVIEGATKIDVQTARSMFAQGVPFVDFRSHGSWTIGHISGAIRCGNVTESNILSIVSKENAAVFYCGGPDCRLAADAAAMAIGWGFTNIHYFAEGYLAWKAAHLPIETAQ